MEGMLSVVIKFYTKLKLFKPLKLFHFLVVDFMIFREKKESKYKRTAFPPRQKKKTKTTTHKTITKQQRIEKQKHVFIDNMIVL